MPMHILNFILNFHGVVFRKINARDDHVIRYNIQHLFKLHILPMCYVVMENKFLQTQLNVT